MPRFSTRCYLTPALVQLSESVAMTRTQTLMAGLTLLWATCVMAQTPKLPEQKPAAPSPAAIDFERAKGYLDKERRGEQLTEEQQKYLNRAKAAIRAGAQPNGRPANAPARPPRDTVGLRPLTEMTAQDRYLEEDGGLYGGGSNLPPDEHQQAAEAALQHIHPLAADGQPSADGRIVFISISMSNATQEFSRFKRIADADSSKSDTLTIVDCAQGGQAMAEWANPQAAPWREAHNRIQNAGVTAEQVQVAWVKLANKVPRGNLTEHGQALKRDTLAVIQTAKSRFPNLQIVYLSSRIYGGYAQGNLNPEPYAYESAFVARWLILDQIRGQAELNHNPDLGAVTAPLLLWGPYLWADGTTPRAADQLRYTRADLADDGTHPSEAGRDKVAQLMLRFFQTDPLAKPWFTGMTR